MAEARMEKFKHFGRKDVKSPGSALRSPGSNPAFHKYSDEEFHQILRLKQMNNQNEIDQIQELIADRRYDEAATRLDQLKLDNPRWVSPVVLKGVMLNSIGEHEKAIFEFQEAIEIKPDVLKARYGLAIAYKELERYDEAEATLSEAMGIMPESAFGAYLYGAVLAKMGKHERAAMKFKFALMLMPDAPERYGFGQMDMAEAFSHIGNVELARRAWIAALEKYPDFRLSNTKSAIRIFMKTKSFKLAIECIDYAILLEPHDSYFYNEKGRALAFLGDNGKALECYDKAIALDGSNCFALQNKARCLCNLGKHGEAIRKYEQVLAIWPNANGYFELAAAMMEHGNGANYEKIIQNLENAIRLEPNNKLFSKSLEMITCKRIGHETRMLLREHMMNLEKSGADYKEFSRWHSSLREFVGKEGKKNGKNGNGWL